MKLAQETQEGLVVVVNNEKVLGSNALFDLIEKQGYFFFRCRKTAELYLNIRTFANNVGVHPQTIKNGFDKLKEIQTTKLPTIHGDQVCSYIPESRFAELVEVIVDKSKTNKYSKLKLQNFLMSFELIKLKEEKII